MFPRHFVYRRIFHKNMAIGIPNSERFLMMPYFFEWNTQTQSFKSFTPAANLVLDYILESIDSVCEGVSLEWHDLALEVLMDQYGTEVLQNAFEIYPGGGCDRDQSIINPFLNNLKMVLVQM